MTLDVTIGKRKSKSHVEKCPDSNEQICSSVHTTWPSESYRSGNNVSFWKFFIRVKELNELYLKMRKHPSTNDLDIALLKPLIKQINKLNESDFEDELDKDRLRWFKYWSNKAVELYGDEAAIMFS